MKKLLLFAAVATMSLTAFAQEKAKCEKSVQKNVLKRINKIYKGDSAETRSIEGVKTLHTGAFIETFAVLASDEVEPSEWIVTVDTRTCRIKYVDVANDGSVNSELWDEFFGI